MYPTTFSHQQNQDPNLRQRGRRWALCSLLPRHKTEVCPTDRTDQTDRQGRWVWGGYLLYHNSGGSLAQNSPLAEHFRDFSFSLWVTAGEELGGGEADGALTRDLRHSSLSFDGGFVSREDGKCSAVYCTVCSVVSDSGRTQEKAIYAAAQTG